MVEKKHVVFDLRLAYNGPLSIEKFYAEVDKWISDNGFQKEPKDKLEDIGPKEKKIEWIVEAWKSATHLVKQVVRLRVLFNNVKEKSIKRNKRTIRLNQAEVLIVIDGFVESEMGHQWTAKPFTQFFRTLFVKYIWDIGQTETERYQGPVEGYCYGLHKTLKKFLDSYSMKLK